MCVDVRIFRSKPEYSPILTEQAPFEKLAEGFAHSVLDICGIEVLLASEILLDNSGEGIVPYESICPRQNSRNMVAKPLGVSSFSWIFVVFFGICCHFGCKMAILFGL